MVWKNWLKNLFGFVILSEEEYDSLIKIRILTESDNLCYYVKWVHHHNSKLISEAFSYDVIGYDKALGEYEGITFIVKRFYYNANNKGDADYAKLCANELCDKLKESY